MSHTPKYSVIIPVYNAEKTLRRCLDSLCEQAPDDVQFLLVNDGSRDGSGDICRAYAQRDPRFTLLNKPNGGVSSARNLGLDAAGGRYVLFVDSDDYVSRDYFSTLEELDRDGRFDMILFSNIRTDGVRNTPRLLTDGSFTGQAVMEELGRAYSRKTINPPWNKRYRLELIRSHGIRFREDISIGEDKLFNLEYALHCESCRTSNAPLYHVSTEVADSLSRKPREDLQEQFARLDAGLEALLSEERFPEENRLPFRKADNFLRYRAVYAQAKRMHRAGAPRSERLRTIRRMCRELGRRHLPVPSGRFCRMICTPVRLRMAWLIDLAAHKLAG